MCYDFKVSYRSLLYWYTAQDQQCDWSIVKHSLSLWNKLVVCFHVNVTFLQNWENSAVSVRCLAHFTCSHQISTNLVKLNYLAPHGNSVISPETSLVPRPLTFFSWLCILVCGREKNTPLLTRTHKGKYVKQACMQIFCSQSWEGDSSFVKRWWDGSLSLSQ